MVIRIEDDPSPLDELLFVRAAWEPNIPDVPPLYPALDVDVGVSARPSDQTVAGLEQLWLNDWNRVWQRFDDHSEPIRIPDEATLREIAETADQDLAQRFWEPADIWQGGIDLDAFNRRRTSIMDDHRRSTAGLSECARRPDTGRKVITPLRCCRRSVPGTNLDR